MAKARKLIIGVDPGTSTSFAAFDLDGNFIWTETIRNPGKEGIIEEILKQGIPVVVATDVAVPPEFVARIASNFNARLFAPDRDMLQRDKEELIKEKEIETENAHERDAAAAAINFIKYYKNKMAWIDRNIDERELRELGDEIKTYVLQGVPLGKVIDYLTAKEEIKEESKETNKELDIGAKEAKLIERKKEELSSLRELIGSNAQLRSLISIISAENKALDKRLRELEKEFHAGIKEDKILKSRDMQIKRLKELLKRQTREIAHLEQNLKNIKRNPEVPEVKEREKLSKKDLEKEDLENLIDAYRERE